MNKFSKIVCVALVVIMLFAISVTCYAHKGNTDSKGGHYDSSTGAYHYHHGYPAHQHTGGVCPYDYDDKTSSNSGYSSSSGFTSTTTKFNYSSNLSSSNHSKSDDGNSAILWVIAIGVIALAIFKFVQCSMPEGDKKDDMNSLFYLGIVVLIIIVFCMI